MPKGILRSADLVNECISHVQFLIEGESIYSELEHGLISQILHKAKMKYRQALDFRSKLSSSSIEIISFTYTIPFTDQIASLDVHIDDSIIIGENVESNFILCLLDDFYKAISILIQMMFLLMGQAQGTQYKQIIYLKNIFLPLLLNR